MLDLSCIIAFLVYNYINFKYEENQINGEIDGSDAGDEGKNSLISDSEDD